MVPAHLFAAPAAVSTVPASGATASLVQDITVTFSEAMDPSTIGASTFTVVGPGNAAVSGSVSYSGLTATFNPTVSLVTDIWYTATVTTGAKNAGGTPLPSARVWSFVTGPLATVNLGAAAPYALLSGAGLSNSPTSAVTGDVGASPIAGTGITGFGLTEVTGTIYTTSAGGPAGSVVNSVGLTAAKGALTTAYNDAAGRTPVPTGAYLNPGAGNLSGLTLVPGLYKFSGAALLSGSDLTLTGGVNDVWIFQIGSSFTVQNGRHIILAGGAQAANIFWQVGTSASIGSTVIMQGTIMADQAITLGTGTTLNGRALAFSAGITLLSNTVTRPDITVPTATVTNPLDLAVGVTRAQVVAVTFSETMLPSSLTSTTFTVKDGATPVTGVVNYSGLTATFTPSAALDATKVYTATVSSGATGARDSARNPLAGDKVWTFTTGTTTTTGDITAPQVSSTDPASGATGVSINQQIAATFSEVMDASTVTTSTVTVTGPGTTPVAGTVTNSGSVFTFHPSGGSLAGNTLFTVKISAAAKDLAGNALSGDYTWTFTTGLLSDVTAPKVSSTDPPNGATGRAQNQQIAATFSEAMDPASVSATTVTLTGPGTTPVAGTVTNVGSVFTFHPDNDLSANTRYTTTITTGVKDLAGNQMASDYSWSFSTGSDPDTVPPTVTFTDPVAGATGVALNKAIAASFTEPMDPLTTTTQFYTLEGPAGEPIPGTVTYAGLTATFHPTSALRANTTYVARVLPGVADLAGNLLQEEFETGWAFTTGSAPDILPPSVTSTDPLAGATAIPPNRQIKATFSESMDPATVTTAVVTLTGPGTTPIDGTITHVGAVFTFTPLAGSMAANTLFTMTIGTGARDLAGNPLVSPHRWTFTTGALPDGTRPQVTFTDPEPAARNVPVNKQIAVTFSESMDPLSMTPANMRVTGPGTTPVIGTVTNVDRVFTFHPLGGDLEANTQFTVTIGVNAKDLAGNTLASAYLWKFTTGTAPDATPPLVSYTTPVDGAAGVATNRRIAASFNESMDPTTVTTATVTVTGPGSTLVPGTVTNVGSLFTFRPLAGVLAGNTRFTVRISRTARDLAGNQLAADYSWSFTTQAAAETIAPTVTSTDPRAGAIGVAVNKQIAATFSEAMYASTVTTATVSVTGPGATPVAGTVTNIGSVFTFHPAGGALTANTQYTVKITTDARDLAGNALARDYDWTFTTGAEVDVTPPLVTFTDPVAGARGIAVNNGIAASFYESMDPTTVTTATVLVRGPGSATVPGTITNVGALFTFRPSGGALAANTLYTVTITTGARDLAGNGLASDFSWSFTTGDAVNDAPPTVSATNPEAGSTGVAVNKQIVASFSETMNPETLTTATVMMTGAGNAPVAGTVTAVGRLMIFHPTGGDLAGNTQFTVTISNDASDLAGNRLNDGYSWSFTTGDIPDVIAPVVTSTDPVAGAQNVDPHKRISAVFSESMDPETVTTSTVWVTGPGTARVSGTLTLVGRVVTFYPTTAMLAGNTTFTVTINAGATDLAGNKLAGSFAWTLTTGSNQIPTAVTEVETAEVPQVFALQDNYPNPFNPSTTIRYQLPEPAAVRLEIFGMLGQRVRTLVAGEQSAGTFQVVWDSRSDGGTPVATGVYFYRLQAGEFVQVRRLLLVR